MKILALIPARGGSKRVPNKNIRLLGGKPLLDWSIDAAKSVSDISDVLVSTDDPRIAELAIAAGASVPWLRPPELATDTASSLDVCLHALNWYESEKGAVDGLLLLQPTSPFRKVQTIRAAINLFEKHRGRPVVSFSPAESHPMWCYAINDAVIRNFVSDSNLVARSQDLPPAYVVNGALYLATPAYLREHATFLRQDTVPLVIDDRGESQDIDTEWDWMFSEYLLRTGQVTAVSSPGNGRKD